MNRRSLLWALVLLCIISGAWGQVPGTSSVLDRLPDARTLQSLLGRDATSGADLTRGVPMEGAVDPTRYTVGPSDLFSIGLWGPISNSYSLSVTPEGSIIIPTVGEIKVDQMKLADMKKEVIGIVKRKYPSSNVTVTLLRPRSFLVTLRGSVLKPGQYTATPVDRLEKILAEGAEALYAGSTVTIPGVTMQEGEAVITKMDSYSAPLLKQAFHFDGETSTRNILLIRRNGDTLRVDLPKYYSTGEDRLNPMLLDGDVIQVPRRDLTRNFVSVLGAVNLPGDYEFATGDSLLDVVAIAGGFSPVADEEHITLSRVDVEGSLVSEQVFSLSAIRSGKQQVPPLELGDRVFIHNRPTVVKRFEVIVAGEVRSPGSYPILVGKTRLSTVIHDAGGFTDRALPSGAYILRRQDKLKDVVDPRLEVIRALRTHQLGLLDSLLFFMEMKAGRDPVVVDFKKLFIDRDSTQDIVLQKDDIIYVPSNFNGVLVHGQVAQAGYVTYVPGKDHLYYVGKAGGVSELANPDEIRIIKRGTLEWVDPKETTIESGDQIWVPKQPKKDFAYYFSWVREGAAVAGSIFSVVYIVIAVRALSK